MCGRYTLIKLSDFTDMFPWIRGPEVETPPPRYNIAPTQAVAVVTNDGENRVEFFHWGLVPFWAKDAAIGSKMINARVESIAEKPAFRTALKRRRCLIPASGFFEWQKLPAGGKQPVYVRLRSGNPFAFAGLWETWRDDRGNELPSCTILTGEPNELVRTIHNRMAVILRDEAQMRLWIDPHERPAAELLPMVTEPFPADEMEAIPVSKRVNSPANDDPRNIEPLERGSEAAAQATPGSTEQSSPTRARRSSRREKRGGPDDSPGLFS